MIKRDDLISFINKTIGQDLLDKAEKVDDMAKAKAFAKDPSLKKAMQKGGVTGAPTISFFTATWQDTATLSTNLRSRTTLTVKDWDAWLKSFEEGKQERIDNGITVCEKCHIAIGKGSPW